MDLALVRRIKAIRRLATTFPAAGMEERMEKIRGLATGDLTPEATRPQGSPDFFERIAAGQASRATRTAADKVEEALARKRQKDEDAEAEAAREARRKARAGRNRMETGGRDRSDESAAGAEG